MSEAGLPQTFDECREADIHFDCTLAIVELNKQLVAMERDRTRWRAAIQELTPGGSEFMDPESVKAFAQQMKRETATAHLERARARKELTSSLAREGEMRRALQEARQSLGYHGYTPDRPIMRNIDAALASPAPSSGEDKSHGASAALPQSSAKCAEAGKGVFTPDEVLALERYQRGEGSWSGFNRMHPFTCGNRGDGNHRDNGIDLGLLVPTVRGWVCPYCDYTQDWAHDFMKDTAPLTTEARYSGEGTSGEDRAKSADKEGPASDEDAAIREGLAKVVFDTIPDDVELVPGLDSEFRAERICESVAQAAITFLRMNKWTPPSSLPGEAGLPNDKARIERLDDVVKAAEEFVLCQNGQNSFYSLATNSFGRLEDALEKLRANP